MNDEVLDKMICEEEESCVVAREWRDDCQVMVEECGVRGELLDRELKQTSIDSENESCWL